jgi:hypothetical protein
MMIYRVADVQQLFPAAFFVQMYARLRLGSRCSVIQLSKEQAAKAAAQLWQHDNPVDLRITTVLKSVKTMGGRMFITVGPMKKL